MFRRFAVLSLLMAPEGGQGSGGTGSDPPNGSTGAGATGGVTEEQVNEIVSKAIGKRLGESEKKQTKALADALKPLTDGIAALTTRLEEGRGGGGDDDAGKGKSGKAGGATDDITQHPAFRTLQKDLENERKAREKRDDELKAQKARTRASDLQKAVENELLSQGVDPKRVNKAAKLMILEGTVGYESEESDEVVFHEKDGPIELNAGVEAWAKSEEGKHWLPPSGAGGSGDVGSGGGKGARRPGNGAQQPSKGDIGRALLTLTGAGTPDT